MSKLVKDLTVDELKNIIRDIVREEINYKILPQYESYPTIPLQVGEPYHKGYQVYCETEYKKGDIHG